MLLTLVIGHLTKDVLLGGDALSDLVKVLLQSSELLDLCLGKRSNFDTPPVATAQDVELMVPACHLKHQPIRFLASRACFVKFEQSLFNLHPVTLA